MPPSLAATDVDLVDDDPPILVCSGEFDVASVDSVMDALLELADARPALIVVDFRPATFVGAAALSCLAAAIADCDRLGVAVELEPCPFLERLFGRAGVDGGWLHGHGLPVRRLSGAARGE